MSIRDPDEAYGLSEGHVFTVLTGTDIFDGYWSSTPRLDSFYSDEFYWGISLYTFDMLTGPGRRFVWPIRKSKSSSIINLPQTGQSSCYDNDGIVISCVGTGQDGELQRGETWPEPRFINNGNGTVTDNLTGLVWLTEANCTEPSGGVVKPVDGLPWSESITWSNNLADGICGLSDNSAPGDWRLPNALELASLINYSSAGAHEDFFVGVQSTGYWTSSFRLSNSSPFPFAALFGGTNSLQYGIKVYEANESYHVWPVRGKQSSYFNVSPASGVNGNISPNTEQVVSPGSYTAFTVIPDTGYGIESVTGCGGSLDGLIYTTDPIVSDCTVTASFAPLPYYKVTPTTDSYGNVSPSSPQDVISGGSTTFTITPDVNYAISSVTGCGGTLNGNTYTTGPITSDCTVTASFFPTLTPVNDNIEFVKQVYEDFLNRDADAAGIDYWTNLLETGVYSRAEIVEMFMGSDEFRGKIAPVARLYFAYFLRIPDYGGLMYWIDQYGQGLSLESISAAFAGSAEFTSTYGSLSNSAFVNLVYQNVLERDPDAAGLSYWTDQLNSGTKTRGEVMAGFSESAEYKSKMANNIYVTMAYIGMLRRSPDQAGYSYWVTQMLNGTSGLILIDGFLVSEEYIGRDFGGLSILGRVTGVVDYRANIYGAYVIPDNLTECPIKVTNFKITVDENSNVYTDPGYQPYVNWPNPVEVLVTDTSKTIYGIPAANINPVDECSPFNFSYEFDYNFRIEKELVNVVNGIDEWQYLVPACEKYSDKALEVAYQSEAGDVPGTKVTIYPEGAHFSANWPEQNHTFVYPNTCDPTLTCYRLYENDGDVSEYCLNPDLFWHGMDTTTSSGGETTVENYNYGCWQGRRIDGNYGYWSETKITNSTCVPGSIGNYTYCATVTNSYGSSSTSCGMTGSSAYGNKQNCDLSTNCEIISSP